MANINVYSPKISSEVDGLTHNVHLENVDTSQVLAEFSAEEIYDALVANDQLSSVLDMVGSDE